MQSALLCGDKEVATVQVLIDRALYLQTAQDISAWAQACMEVGIDPF